MYERARGHKAPPGASEAQPLETGTDVEEEEEEEDGDEHWNTGSTSPEIYDFLPSSSDESQEDQAWFLLGNELWNRYDCLRMNIFFLRKLHSLVYFLVFIVWQKERLYVFIFISRWIVKYLIFVHLQCCRVRGFNSSITNFLICNLLDKIIAFHNRMRLLKDKIDF